MHVQINLVIMFLNNFAITLTITPFQSPKNYFFYIDHCKTLLILPPNSFVTTKFDKTGRVKSKFNCTHKYLYCLLIVLIRIIQSTSLKLDCSFFLCLLTNSLQQSFQLIFTYLVLYLPSLNHLY